MKAKECEPRFYLYKVSPLVELLIECELGKCERCGEPAGLVLWNGKRYCGIQCYQAAKPKPLFLGSENQLV